MQNKTYFVNFSNLEYGLKSGKEPYVEGYITTEDIDHDNERVSPEAMDEILKSLKSGSIKLDIEHSQFLSDEPDLPIGKIVEAKKVTENGNTKIWIKAILNKAHTKFGEVWQSIKGGFIDAFSIAYNVKHRVEEMVDDQVIKTLKSIELLNVALTGNPCNSAASMTGNYMKSSKVQKEEVNGSTRYSLKYLKVSDIEDLDRRVSDMESKLKNQGGIQMTEPELKEDVPKQEEQPEEKVEEKVEDKPVEEPEPEAPVEEQKSVSMEEHTALKTKVEEQEKIIKEMKAKLEEPQLKSIVDEPGQEPEPKAEVELTPLQMIQ